jgi:hypothetical protein
VKAYVGLGVDFGGSFPRGAVYLSLRAWRGGCRVHFGFKQREGRETLCISACVRVLYLDDSEGLVRESERKREKSMSVEVMRGEKKKINKQILQGTTINFHI